MTDAFPLERNIFGVYFMNSYEVAAKLVDERGLDFGKVAFFPP